jgi:tellurite resistance-related uncharacterized protein
LSSRPPDKKEFLSDYNIRCRSLIPNGVPKGGPGTAELVYYPNIIWNPFADTAIGSGSFNVAVQQNQFWTKATQPNDWGVSGYQYNQLMYTHTRPGSWSWLSVTVGQCPFLAYDDNLYAGNAQTNFLSLPLAQGGLGAYAQGPTPQRRVCRRGRVPGRYQRHRGKFDEAGFRPASTRVRGGRMVGRTFSTGGLQHHWV